LRPIDYPLSAAFDVLQRGRPIYLPQLRRKRTTDQLNWAICGSREKKPWLRQKFTNFGDILPKYNVNGLNEVRDMSVERNEIMKSSDFNFVKERGSRGALRSQDSAKNPQRSCGAFTLVELLIVVGIIGVLLVLLAPAFTNIKTGNNVTSAAYTIKDVLETARTYAKANNTYTWVGFFEEDAPQSSTNPANPGTGRIVMSIVASNGGTMLYATPLGSPFTLDAAPNQTALTQVGKLTKVDNVHLKTFAPSTGTPPPDTFDTRPAAAPTARIGDTTPATPYLSFGYPVGSLSPQYAFTKIIQFSPRGEGVVDNSNYFASGASFEPVSEIGLQPTHGTTLDNNTANLVAVQFTGLGGNVKIYRK
jgi:prepilin-type N-terminal cleavage/methylation domain-containing protein